MIPSKTLKCGFSMPVFGMGTWMMGGNSQRNHDNDDVRDINALTQGIEHGLTHIDTAEMYADGFAERIVGRAIKCKSRKEVFITSKVWNSNLKHDDVVAAVERSLERMGTDYIDLYLIHKPNDDIPVTETMQALNTLKDRGLIKDIGVSNFTIKRFEEAQAVSNSKLVANQLHYNLIIREAETKGLLDYCQQNDIMLIAWRPIQKGLFKSCKDPSLKQVCHKYGKSPVQIAINWLVSQDNVVTMSTMRSENHIKENCGALGWEMEQDDVELLRKQFSICREVSDSVPLV